jgi:hypothetical protein
MFSAKIFFIGGVREVTQTGDLSVAVFFPRAPKQNMRLQGERPKGNLLWRAGGTSVIFRESREDAAK